MSLTRAAHWDAVYAGKPADEVSWYQREPTVSLRLLASYAPAPASVLDVGAGASTLADRLVDGGWDVTLLDVSAEALAVVRSRLADRAAYIVSDLLAWTPDRGYQAWHDRAVFHFLTDPADQERYVGLAAEAVPSGGVVVLGTFAEDGPESCSGLPTARWSTERLAARFAPAFAPAYAEREEHLTPWGAAQPFTWVVLRRL
jgi:hypothetical protein